MPVLVTGVEHGAGRACARALLRAGGEVRAYLDPFARSPGGEGPDPPIGRLRASGVKVASGTLDDEGALELALAGVHTIAHAGADLLADPDDIVEELATVVSAALGAGCRRLVLLSHLGAGDPQGNPWLAALAEAEDLLVETPMETVVVRRALTYGLDDAVTDALAESTGGAQPDAMHTPIWIDDLAAGVAAADARDREGAAVPHLSVVLGGPRLMSLGELVARLGGQVIDPSVATVRLPAHVVEVLSRDLVPDAGTPSAGTSPERGAALVREGWG